MFVFLRAHLSSPVLKTALQTLYLTDLDLYIPAQLLVLRGQVLEIRRPLIRVLRTAENNVQLRVPLKIGCRWKNQGHELGGSSRSVRNCFRGDISYSAIQELFAC